MSNKQRFSLSLLNSQLRGVRLIVFYLMTISTSIATAAYVFNNDILPPIERKQYQLEKMRVELAKKEKQAANYKSLQISLDAIHNGKYSCATKPEGKFKDKRSRQDECVDKDFIIKRLIKFNKDAQAYLRVFNNPEAVLKLLASSTRDFNLDKVRYKTVLFQSSDFSDLVLKLDARLSPTQLVQYIKKLGKDCASCLIKLSSFSYDNNRKIVNASFEINLYLDPVSINRKQALKQWRQAISDGELSGDDLASYIQPDTANH